jgi:hypothetical protein
MQQEVRFQGWDHSTLVEAIRLWTGKGRESHPSRHDSRVIDHFGAEVGTRLLATLRYLETEFYKSDAGHTAPSIPTMATQAEEDFRNAFPHTPDEIAEVLAWCYTFDFK